MPALTTSKEKPDSLTPRPVTVDQVRAAWATGALGQRAGPVAGTVRTGRALARARPDGER